MAERGLDPREEILTRWNLVREEALRATMQMSLEDQGVMLDEEDIRDNRVYNRKKISEQREKELQAKEKEVKLKEERWKEQQKAMEIAYREKLQKEVAAE